MTAFCHTVMTLGTVSAEPQPTLQRVAGAIRIVAMPGTLYLTTCRLLCLLPAMGLQAVRNTLFR